MTSWNAYNFIHWWTILHGLISSPNLIFITNYSLAVSLLSYLSGTLTSTPTTAKYCRTLSQFSGKTIIYFAVFLAPDISITDLASYIVIAILLTRLFIESLVI